PRNGSPAVEKDQHLRPPRPRRGNQTYARAYRSPHARNGRFTRYCRGGPFRIVNSFRINNIELCTPPCTTFRANRPRTGHPRLETGRPRTLSHRRAPTFSTQLLWTTCC